MSAAPVPAPEGPKPLTFDEMREKLRHTADTLNKYSPGITDSKSGALRGLGAAIEKLSEHDKPTTAPERKQTIEEDIRKFYKNFHPEIEGVTEAVKQARQSADTELDQPGEHHLSFKEKLKKANHVKIADLGDDGLAIYNRKNSNLSHQDHLKKMEHKEPISWDALLQLLFGNSQTVLHMIFNSSSVKHKAAEAGASAINNLPENKGKPQVVATRAWNGDVSVTRKDENGQAVPLSEKEKKVFLNAFNESAGKARGYNRGMEAEIVGSRSATASFGEPKPGSQGTAISPASSVGSTLGSENAAQTAAATTADKESQGPRPGR